MATEATSRGGPAAPVGCLATRLAAVRGALAVAQLDALVVTAVPHLFYLANLRATAGMAVVTREPAGLHLIVDFRYQEAVRALVAAGHAPAGLQVVSVESSYEETLARTVRALAPARLGVEADHLTVRQWRWLERAVPAELVPVVELVERLRMVKDSHEVAVLRAAGAMLADAVAPAVACVAAGRTEREVAREIDGVLVAAGFERPAFDTIVASGPNGALPHAQPGDRRLEPGDLVVLDFGGVHHGYCVDISRTVAVGRLSPERRRLHRAVREAQAAAMGAAAPGVAPSEVDRAARVALERHRLADAFGHSTGHGLGIEVHELPRVGRPRPADDAEGVSVAALQPGMVFTIEPGVYLPGVAGVRIEDDVLMTAGGIEVLTPASRGLTVG